MNGDRCHARAARIDALHLDGEEATIAEWPDNIQADGPF
jgi:hypothetical protein